MDDGPRVPGRDAGTFVVTDDFDAPLPDDLLTEFETSSLCSPTAD